MKDVAVNRSGGQPPKSKRVRRTPIYTQVKQLKAAGVPVARLIFERDGTQIIELVGATDGPSPDNGEKIVL